MRGNALHARRSLIHLHLVGILAVPVGGDAEADRPVCRLVENRGVLVVPELVAVVFEDLAEIVEFGPSLMAGGAGKSILTCEGRNGLRARTGGNQEQRQRNQGQGPSAESRFLAAPAYIAYVHTVSWRRQLARRSRLP